MTLEIKISISDKLKFENSTPIILSKDFDINKLNNNNTLFDQLKAVSKYIQKEKTSAHFFTVNDGIIVANVVENKSYPLESYRVLGNLILNEIKKFKLEDVCFEGKQFTAEEMFALLEGLLLSAYSFEKYKSGEKKIHQLKINLVNTHLSDNLIKELENLALASKITKDLVNEPPAYYSPELFSDELSEHIKGTGLSIEVLKETQIQSLKMGGLIAVNQGSSAPPTFNIIKWEPENAVNEKPIVLVGKGILYDTGGLSIKTAMMELMKSDMAGGAAVFGTILLAALNKLPVKIYCLIPVTDNRVSSDAYAPGDVIRMFNKKTVEVLNTDAEGRLILADALAYAEKFNPELVIDVATLTGAAVRAVGSFGNVMMGNANENFKSQLKKAGELTYERLVELPLWEEYTEQIKSDIADIKNIGGAEAGAQTAGAFLKEFVNSDWMHIDIAPYAFLSAAQSYRSKGATAAGLRSLYSFLKNYKK